MLFTVLQCVNKDIIIIIIPLLFLYCRDVLQYVKIDSRFFHKDQFLQSINPDQREFYMMVAHICVELF